MNISDPLEIILQEWFSLFRHRMMGSFFAYARDRGLSMAQLGAMFHIFHKGACGVSDIGTDLGVTNSAASQLLERLVQLKLITRSEDLKDRRVKQIVLTDAGRQVLQDISEANKSWMEGLVQILTEDEKSQVRSAVVTLIDKARQLDKAAVGA